MKKTTILYWAVTGIFCAFMLLGAVPDVLQIPDAQGFFRHLGYPLYLLPFLGVAKILGVIAVLVPAFRGLKEWAYAGITFDLVGAFYSHFSVGDPASVWIFPIIGIVLMASSYFLYRRKLDLSHSSTPGRTRSRHSGPNGTALPIST
jgi:hypothetical protein